MATVLLVGYWALRFFGVISAPPALEELGGSLTFVVLILWMDTGAKLNAVKESLSEVSGVVLPSNLDSQGLVF